MSEKNPAKNALLKLTSIKFQNEKSLKEQYYLQTSRYSTRLPQVDGKNKTLPNIAKIINN